jgi:hypothetical protein
MSCERTLMQAYAQPFACVTLKSKSWQGSAAHQPLPQQHNNRQTTNCVPNSKREQVHSAA